ncbi:uncharacterized protein LOC142354334 [Convolutriloba macropyga]|uniref:uncharacterized protein LOC142354334 n=1 Tax=Convolutriloba macropyga TaxID=536237 RepID=UPI003F528300
MCLHSFLFLAKYDKSDMNFNSQLVVLQSSREEASRYKQVLSHELKPSLEKKNSTEFRTRRHAVNQRDLGRRVSHLETSHSLNIKSINREIEALNYQYGCMRKEKQSLRKDNLSQSGFFRSLSFRKNNNHSRSAQSKPSDAKDDVSKCNSRVQSASSNVQFDDEQNITEVKESAEV